MASRLVSRTHFECAAGSSVLTSIIGTIMAANIVGVMIASRYNWASMPNYVERILRLKKRDLEAAGLDDTGSRARRYTKQEPG